VAVEVRPYRVPASQVLAEPPPDIPTAEALGFLASLAATRDAEPIDANAAPATPGKTTERD
jgi:hypothetical protein